MKHFTYTFLFLTIFACDQNNAWDCIQTSGPLVIEELTLVPFEKILVNRDISLTIKQGADYKVDVETGEIIEFQNEALEEMKRQVALKMGYELVDHRLELFGKKIKK